MKLNIQITQIGTGLKTDEKIAEIDVCNGNWKYWDNYMETDEKISLTLNTINEAHYIHLPLKDAIGHYDPELLKQHEFKVDDAIVRTYDNLLSYLNCRINNVKEDVKSGIYDIVYKEKGGMTFTATIFEDNERHDEPTVISDIVYNCETMIEVKISRVE